MTKPIQSLSFDRAIAVLGDKSVADFQATGKLIAELFGVSTETVSQAVSAYWEKTDPFTIVDGKVLVRIGVDGALLRVDVDGAVTLVEFGTAGTDGTAVLSAPAVLLERCSHLRNDTVGGHLEEVRGWLEHNGHQVVGG